MEPNESDLEPTRIRVRNLRSAGWRALHERSGVPFSTIRKFAYGEVEKPLYPTIEAIKAALPGVEAERAA